MNEYLTKAGNVYKESTCLCANPPVQPRGGLIFLYDLGPDQLKWERTRRRYGNLNKHLYFICVSDLAIPEPIYIVLIMYACQYLYIKF